MNAPCFQEFAWPFFLTIFFHVTNNGLSKRGNTCSLRGVIYKNNVAYLYMYIPIILYAQLSCFFLLLVCMWSFAHNMLFCADNLNFIIHYSYQCNLTKNILNSMGVHMYYCSTCSKQLFHNIQGCSWNLIPNRTSFHLLPQSHSMYLRMKLFPTKSLSQETW